MASNGKNGRLPLPSLSVSGFRGIRQLKVKKLGRVTLLAGKNGVGKTTALEAVQMYASRAQRPGVWSSLLRRHDEYLTDEEQTEERNTTPNIAALFFGREPGLNDRIRIGPVSGKQQLSVEYHKPRRITDDEWKEIKRRLKWGEEWDDISAQDFVNFMSRQIWVEFGNHRYSIVVGESLESATHKQGEGGNGRPVPVACRKIGPGLPNALRLAQMWDWIVLAKAEERAVRTLQRLCGPDLKRVVAVGDDSPESGEGRRVLVEFEGKDGMVPLRSLGDGAVRYFGIIAALSRCQNGILLIDEIENGIHHSMQADMWRMILHVAADSNVQVLATTHGWDCIKGFATAATEDDTIEGALVRLEGDNGNLRAVEYSETNLHAAATHGIEVR